MFETAIYTLRLDDKTSREGPGGHLTPSQRLSLFETVWENIPYKMLDKLVEEIKQNAN